MASLRTRLALWLGRRALLARVAEELPIPVGQLPLELCQELELLGAFAFSRR
jgi:hypothetical protein